MNSINPQQIKKEFPMLTSCKNLVYLDTAASSQTPSSVLAVVTKFYNGCRANVHRGMYKASEEATDAYEEARSKVATFLNADEEEVVFTRGTTDSLNVVAASFGATLKKGDEVVVTGMEHHANIVPWQQSAKKNGFSLKVIPVKEDKTLDMEAAKNLIGPNTKAVSMIWASNVLGTVNPIADLIKLAKAQGAISIVDAAQAAGHMIIDVKELDCDFLAFSGHKMFAPTGVGILFGKAEQLNRLDPYMFGGDMIREVTWEESTWNDIPLKFEAGTPNIGGAIGLGAAVDYVQNLGIEAVHAHEEMLMKYATQKVGALDKVTLHGPPVGFPRVGVLSFTIEGMHTHDIVTLLDEKDVAVRGGAHCAMPLLRDLGLNGTTRASFSVYNSTDDVDRLVEAIEYAKQTFKI